MSEVTDNVSESGELVSQSCLLCCSSDGIFTDIYLKKFAETLALLEETLQVQLIHNELKSKMLCQRCIFKLRIVKEFNDGEMAAKTNIKLCMICSETPHIALKTTYPVVKDKLIMWNKLKWDLLEHKSECMLCTTCFHKLELFEELKMQATANLAGNKICDIINDEHTKDISISSNKERLMSVKDLVEDGLIKVENSIVKDTKMYINVLKVRLITISEGNNGISSLSPKSKPINKDKIKKVNKQGGNSWKVKLNSKSKKGKQQKKKGKNTHSKEEEDNIDTEDVETILEKPAASKKRSAATTEKATKKRKISDGDENLNNITIHKDDVSNKVDVKVAVIVLTREEFPENTEKTTSQKKATKDEEEHKLESENNLSKDELTENVTEEPDANEPLNNSEEIVVSDNEIKDLETENTVDSVEDNEGKSQEEVLENEEIEIVESNISTSQEPNLNDEKSSSNGLSDKDEEIIEKDSVIVESNTNTIINEEDDVTLPKFSTDDSELSEAENISKQTNVQENIVIEDSTDSEEKANEEEKSDVEMKKNDCEEVEITETDSIESISDEEIVSIENNEPEEVSKEKSIIVVDEDTNNSEDELSLIAKHIKEVEIGKDIETNNPKETNSNEDTSNIKELHTETNGIDKIVE